MQQFTMTEQIIESKANEVLEELINKKEGTPPVSESKVTIHNFV